MSLALRAHCLSRLSGRKSEPPKSMEKGGQRLRNEVMEGAGDKIREQATLRSVRSPSSLVQSRRAESLTKKQPGAWSFSGTEFWDGPQRDLTVSALSFLSTAMVLDVGRTRPPTLLGGNSRPPREAGPRHLSPEPCWNFLVNTVSVLTPRLL